MNVPEIPNVDAEIIQTDRVVPLVFDLDFTYRRPPLTANKKPHWRERARLTRQTRTDAIFLARAARIPDLGRIHVSLIWYVADRRRRDGGENVAPTLKPMIDGLVDAGVVIDDTPDLVIRDMPVIEYRPGETPHMVLRVAQILPTAEENAA